MKSSILAVAFLGIACSPVRAEATSPKEEVVIEVKADGSAHVGGKKLTLDELAAELVKLAEKNKDRPVRIRGEDAVEYQRITEVIDVCQKAGLHGISIATKQADVDESGYGACEDKLEAVAEIAPELDSKFFGTVKTSRQPWLIEHDDGSLENTMGDAIAADDLLLIEQTADCISTHQGEHAMELCDAVKTEDGVVFELWGGAPAYMSSLAVTIDAKRQFSCRFKASYPAATSPLRWKITRKEMKLKSVVGGPGARLRGWLSVEFEEIDGATGEAKSYKIEGYFKPVIQSAPAAEPEEDK